MAHGLGSSGPLVSVVVPGLNVAGYVGDALHSLTRQFADSRDIEVVFVDDGSTDGGRAIVEDFTPRFPHLSIVRNETPNGLAAARNQGLRECTGEYVTFLDADDWFAPGHLKVLADEMRRLDCDFVRTDVVMTWGTVRSVKQAPQAIRGVKLRTRDGILPIRTYTMVDHPWAQAGMYHSRLVANGLLEFIDGLHTAEDRPWIWGLFLHADSYAVVDAPGFIYRRGSASALTQILDQRRLDYITAFDAVRTLVETDVDRVLYIPKVIENFIAITSNHMESYDLMPPDVQDALVARAGALLHKFSPDELHACVDYLTEERQEMVEQLMRADSGGERRP